MIDERKVIRHISAATRGSIVAVAQYRSLVQVWDTGKSKRLSAFKTTLDYGGTRLAITDKGDLCITGSFNEDGVACYNAETGVEVWRRRDINTPQRIRISRHGKYVYCCCEDQQLHILRIKDGASDHLIKKVNDIWESPFNLLRVHEARNSPFEIFSNDGKLVGKIRPKTFAALDAAFAPDLFCVSEAGGPISCYDVQSQRELWAHPFPKDTHALKLGYAEDSGHFTAISCEYVHSGQHHGLVFDIRSGNLVAQYPLPSEEYSFLPIGDRLLSSSGTIYNSVNGEKITQLEFFPAIPSDAE